MIGAPPFPISIGELTAPTLSTVLGADVENFSSERIGADRGMMGEIFVVRPRYSADTHGPAEIVCKFAALREGSLAAAKRGGTNERELRCYDELLVNTAVSTPRFYGAWYDPATAHFLLVQEALEADGSVDQVAGIAPELASLVAGEAAQLHHERWNDQALNDLAWLPRLDDPRRIENLTALATNGWGPLCDLLGDQLSPAERSLGAEFPDRLRSSLHALAELPFTLVHSDLRADNLLFSADHRSVALIDWQGCGVGPGSFDMAYLVTHSLSVDDRREHADELIADYLACLASAGTVQSQADFMAGFRLSLHYGLAVATAMPLISDTSQPRVKELAGAMARRSIAALGDYGLLW